jgi:prevent-host-death family protein
MTIYDYLMVMKNTVRIAELKSRLSEYLRRVRRGQSITVLERDTPVARLEPISADTTRLVVREPTAGAPRPRAVRLPPPLKTKRDILALLAEERGEQ